VKELVMIRFVRMKGPEGCMFGLGTGAAAMLLCFAFLVGGASPAAAQGGIILIDGYGLARIIAGELRWKRQPERNYTPRTSRSRSASKTRAASRSGTHKSHVKKTRTEVARKSTKPSREESGNKADNTAPAADTEQHRSATPPTNASSPTARDPKPSATVPSTQAGAALAPPPQPSPLMSPATAPAETPADAASAASSSISTPAEITSAQEHLKFMGYDVPQASGALDLKTTIAIIQFQDSIGAPTTGLLTREQLGTLFQEAAAGLQAQQPHR
jgi:hypothetical protein